MINRNYSKITIALVLSVVLLGSIMRAPITTLPMMIKPIATSLETTPAALSLLTTIPLLMFMTISTFAAKTMNHLGIKRAMTLAISLVVLGAALRTLASLSLMLVGTMFMGAGIAYLNVFMPSFVVAFFPNKIGVYTSIYSLTIMMGVAVFNLITVPIMKMFGWQSVMVIIFGLTVMALLVWLFAKVHAEPKIETKNQSTDAELEVEKKPLHLYTNPRAWALMITFGTQSLINYTVVAWMPSLMTYEGVADGDIGWIMAVYSLVGMPISILVPNILVRMTRRKVELMIIATGLLGLLSAYMMFDHHTDATWYWVAQLFLMGYVTSFFFLYGMTMFAQKTDNHMQTAALAGMAQAGGYLLASTGPVAYGIAYAINPEGMTQNWVYLGLMVVLLVAGVYTASYKKVFS